MVSPASGTALPRFLADAIDDIRRHSGDLHRGGANDFSIGDGIHRTESIGRGFVLPAPVVSGTRVGTLRVRSAPGSSASETEYDRVVEGDTNWSTCWSRRTARCRRVGQTMELSSKTMLALSLVCPMSWTAG